MNNKSKASVFLFALIAFSGISAAPQKETNKETHKERRAQSKTQAPVEQDPQKDRVQGNVMEKLSTPQLSTLQYVSSRKMLSGISHGFMALDSRPLILQERLFVLVEPGSHTVWFVCPSSQSASSQNQNMNSKNSASSPAPPSSQPLVLNSDFPRGLYSSLRYDFGEGKMYELVCIPGKPAAIRERQGC